MAVVVEEAVAGVVRVAGPLERNVTAVERCASRIDQFFSYPVRLVILLVPVQMGVPAMVDTLRFPREKLGKKDLSPFRGIRLMFLATHVGEVCFSLRWPRERLLRVL